MIAHKKRFSFVKKIKNKFRLNVMENIYVVCVCESRSSLSIMLKMLEMDRLDVIKGSHTTLDYSNIQWFYSKEELENSTYHNCSRKFILASLTTTKTTDFCPSKSTPIENIVKLANMDMEGDCFIQGMFFLLSCVLCVSFFQSQRIKYQMQLQTF